MKGSDPRREDGNRGGRSRQGFTLVELLLVITILTVLVSLLLPTLKSVRGESRAAACLNNMRQLGVGWLLYGDEWGWIPQNYMEGWYWAKPAGQPYFYSGIQAWMSTDDYLYNHPTNSVLSGIGHTWPYVRDPRAYFCPANPSSERWFRRWKGEGDMWGFGVPGRGALTTYMYRNGMFPFELNPASSVSFNMAFTPVSVGDLRLRNRVMLTDFWFGYQSSANLPNYQTIPHQDGKVINLVWTDGHASPWKLPEGILPIWGWFGGGSYSAATFDQGFYKQCEWWWVVADRSGG